MGETSEKMATLAHVAAGSIIELAQIIKSIPDGAMLRAHTRANNCQFSAPKWQGNVTSQGPKIIARLFSMVTKENALRVNCTSLLDLLSDRLFTYYVYRLKLTEIEYSRYRSKYLR